MKKIITLYLNLCMTATLAAPAYALEYSIDAPDDYDFGRNTSIDVIHTADGGAMRNEDVSKNAALIPPFLAAEKNAMPSYRRVSDTQSCSRWYSRVRFGHWRRCLRRCHPRQHGETAGTISPLCCSRR